MRLKDKVALVTGGASGIGAAICTSFAREGAYVAIADLNLEGARKVAEEIKAAGGKALALKCDVTRWEEVGETVKKVIAEAGRVDILVNDAAVWTIKRFVQMERRDWDRDMGVCFYGVLNCSRAVLDKMIAQNSGKIISIVSDAGRIGEPTLTIYSAAKAAVNVFSKALAKEVARHKITVNCVSPGTTETPGAASLLEKWGKERLVKAYPLGRLGQPQDVANAVLFLASSEADFITGQTLSVNGGYTTL